jgi:hypothetical protein
MRNFNFVTPHTGTNYILSGGGGALLYPVFDTFPVVAFGQSANHYLRVEVRETQLTVHAIRYDGVELDTYTIKPAPILADDPNVQAVAISPGLVAGATINVRGYNLATEEKSSDAPVGPTSVGGSAVSVNGVPVPLLYVSPNQIYGQLPGPVDGNVSVRVTTANGFVEKGM